MSRGDGDARVPVKETFVAGHPRKSRKSRKGHLAVGRLTAGPKGLGRGRTGFSWHGHPGRGRTGFQPVLSDAAAKAVLPLNTYLP